MKFLFSGLMKFMTSGHNTRAYSKGISVLCFTRTGLIAYHYDLVIHIHIYNSSMFLDDRFIFIDSFFKPYIVTYVPSTN